jgi:vacuolar-type H+-ATPase subunit E/Vma4
VAGAARVRLAAVEDSALTAAHAEANGIRSAARDQAEQLIDEAQAEAAALLARWRATAEQLADVEERRRLAEARTQARANVLAAQRSVRTEAIAAAHAAAQGLAGNPRYQRLLDRLSQDARSRLSGDGPVEVAASPGGGFVARAGTRQIDYSVHTQVERCIQGMAHDLERLWQ